MNVAVNHHYDVIIIGAGASGLFCAATALKRERSVLILERSNKVGKKILMSGGGRCNFTNLFVSHENYISDNSHFSKSALNRYNQWQFIELVESYAVDYHERKHGELFCDHSAKDILALLQTEAELADLQLKTEVENIQALDNGDFLLKTNRCSYQCQSLVVATGGLSIPTLGGSGLGYQLAEQFGLQVFPRRAGLVPFTFSGGLKSLCESLSGLALEVEMFAGGCSFRENLLFTHRGMSGPVVLQCSNYWQLGEEVVINLLPDEELQETLLTAKHVQPKGLLRTVLNNYLAKSLVLALQELFWSDESDKLMADFSDQRLMTIAKQLQAWHVKPSGTEGYRTAEVTLGGVDCNELSSKTMEAKKQPGLYFIGEVVDVTGHLGGFNFQWAWASGFAAGNYV